MLLASGVWVYFLVLGQVRNWNLLKVFKDMALELTESENQWSREVEVDDCELKKN